VTELSEFELVTLRNGQRAVRHIPSGEVMHPSVGPWEEANTLYVEQLGLVQRLQAAAGAPLVVFDVGLGAATNALAALDAAMGLEIRRPLVLHSFEQDLSPLRLALADPAGFPVQARFHDAARALLEHGRWSAPGIRWQLQLGDVRTLLPRMPDLAELVFYDPFSPEVNPSLWTVPALKTLRARCREDGAVVATYSVATPTRLSFLLAGFHVGQGRPVGAKRETTVAATRRELLERPLGRDFLARWRRSSARAPHGQELTPELAREIEQRLE
jgi:hypothetical protein